jgi:uncharacterized LabA/DUF88 family protein
VRKQYQVSSHSGPDDGYHIAGDGLNLTETGRTGVWIDFENMSISFEDMQKTEKVRHRNFLELLENILGDRIDIVTIRVFFSEIDLFRITEMIFDEKDPIWKRYAIRTPFQNINDTLELKYVEGKAKRPARKLEFVQCWMKGKIDHGTLKSTLDTWLVTDLISTLYEQKELKTFIVVSGDADYAPAIRHLLARGKKVIVMFDEEAASQHLRQDVADRASDGESYRFVGLREWLRSQKSRT